MPRNCKPGWGYGDENHCHNGPPGQCKDAHGRGRDDKKECHHHSPPAWMSNPCGHPHGDPSWKPHGPTAKPFNGKNVSSSTSSLPTSGTAAIVVLLGAVGAAAIAYVLSARRRRA
jgi:hypothetical protein